jgi:chorismate dehydratase
LGSVPYLNAKPLCWAIDGAELLPPPALLERLRRGTLDAALLSSIEWLKRPEEFDRVEGLGIASDGAVESVRLYVRGRPAEVRRLKLDPHSLSANALARGMLAKRFGARFDVVEEEFDAEVVIGDEALRRSGGDYLDLGREWKEWTGLPFVFAMWIFRRGLAESERLGRELRRACASGCARLEEIARVEAGRLGLDAALCLNYLRSSVRYSIGPREEQGLARFRGLLQEMGEL